MVKRAYKPWQNVFCDADDSGKRQYRYILSANVNKAEMKKPLVIIGINPSKANDQEQDNTIIAVEKLAIANKYDGYIMINVYPQRATNIDDNDENTRLPENGFEEKNQIEKNIQKIYNTVEKLQYRDILLAYGTLIYDREYLSTCLKQIIQRLNELQPHYKYIALTGDGHPCHPLGPHRNHRCKAEPLGDSFKIQDINNADLKVYLNQL